MSTVPPEPVPPPNPLPWEARETRGLLPSFFDTLGLLVTRPTEAWARMRESGDSTSPLLFGTAVCWLSMALHSVLFSLIAMAILHFCCMLVGALQNSRSGFEGSLRAVCYSEVSSLASVIPVVGGLIAIVWWIVLAVQGVERLHRTTSGKAVAAVLIPVVVCCGGLLLIGLVVGAAILGRFGR